MSTDKARAAQIKRLEVQMKKPENRECFDCTSKQPRWASTNLGIFFCLSCAGIHRSLGVHISKVKSTTMDAWEEHMMQCVERIGNGRGKELYEHGFSGAKLDVNAPSTDKERVIRKKYEQKAYYNPRFDELHQQYLAGPSPAAAAAPPVVLPVTQVSGHSKPTTQGTPNSSSQSPALLGTGQSKPTTRGVDWGGFETASSGSPAQVTPSSQQQTSPKGNGDFWTNFDKPAQSPSSGVPTSEFGGFQAAEQQQTDGGNLMSFKPTLAPTPVDHAKAAKDKDDIMAAFGPTGGAGPRMAQPGPGGMGVPPGQQQGRPVPVWAGQQPQKAQPQQNFLF